MKYIGHYFRAPKISIYFSGNINSNIVRLMNSTDAEKACMLSKLTVIKNFKSRVIYFNLSTEYIWWKIVLVIAVDIRSRIRTQRLHFNLNLMWVSDSDFVFDPNEWLCSRRRIEPLNKDMTVGLFLKVPQGSKSFTAAFRRNK